MKNGSKVKSRVGFGEDKGKMLERGGVKGEKSK